MVWLFLLLVGVLAYRLWFVPSVEKKEAQEQANVLDETSGNSNYKHRIQFGLDGFSGYAILRSDEMAQQLRSRGIKFDFVDDGADYETRLNDLASGKLQMAAFPIDALLKASERIAGLPATIIAIIDETRGADAVVAYKSKFPTIDALNSPETKFVFVGDSPSETLVRVVMHKFQLDALSADSFQVVATERELLDRYRRAKPGGNEVFATWEPVVSELMKNKSQMHVLVDSSRETGFIVDAMVVSRDFMVKNDTLVHQILESYFRALYAFNDEEKLVSLIERDARDVGATINQTEAQKLVSGIVWKNTQENFAHLGLRSASVTHIEDMIDRIKRVLLETKGLKTDPTGGDSSKLFFEKPLSELLAAGFHPGVSPEAVREDEQVNQLSPQQWEKLVPVGTAQVPPLIYARGTAKLTQASKTKLDDLVENLKSWPMYYVMVRGNASSRGDAEANRILAKQRADAALQYLVTKGVPQAKLRAMDGEITGQISVTFLLGQQAY